MAGKQLRADIVIGGRTDESFYQLGSQIEQFGRRLNGLSGIIIDFGKQSLDAYINYDDAMRDAEVALGTTYESSRELGKVMETLDKNAMSWATNTRFTTKDIATAISEAAHAGWDLEKILAGIPNAINVSLAGGMELAEGLEYLIDITNASGISFEELTELTDYWAYAANSTSTTIPEMGEAMQRMGATLQFFKGDMAAVTTMLGVLANNGTKGSEAGTLLRNSIIRLIAPTQKAYEAMEGLDLSAEELEEIYGDTESLERATKLLEDVGFSAYDSEGNLKSFIDIWQELDAATRGMSEEDRNTVLSAIFPSRTITGALALLDSASRGWDGLYASILGESSGYSANAMDIMEGGLGGTMRRLKSAWDALEVNFGRSLKDDAGYWIGMATDWVNSINSLDEATFGAIVRALETIAVAGPGMIVAGQGIKLISSLFTGGVTGKILLGAVALGAVVAALDAINDANYRDAFGTMGVDMDALQVPLARLSGNFHAAYSEIERYNGALETAASDYGNLTSTLSDNMLSAMITGNKLSESDIQYMYGLGTQIRDAMFAGINANYSEGMELVLGLSPQFNTVEDMMDSNTVWSGIIGLLVQGYDDDIATMNSLSQQLRDAMFSAFEDGELTEEEIKTIQGIFDQMDELMAKQIDRENYAQRQKILRQGRTLGIEGIGEAAAMLYEQRDREWEWAQTEYDKQRYDLIQLGATQQQLDAWDFGVSQKRFAHYAESDRILLDMYDNAVMNSDYSDAWDYLGTIADNAIANGGLSYSDLMGYAQQFVGWGNVGTGVHDFAIEFINGLGGKDAVLEKMNTAAAIGDYETANQYQKALMMYDIAFQTPNSAAFGGTSWHDILDVINLNIPVYANTAPAAAQINSFMAAMNALKAYIPVTAAVKGGASSGTLSAAPAGTSTGSKSGVSSSNPAAASKLLNLINTYAEGGRADEASIFGEAGAEWAIPEQHSQRTAELLNAARRASGFTWDELLSRNGGLNAGGSGDRTFVFSPTIYANDGRGVKAALDAERPEMEKWFRDRLLHEEVEVYA